MIWLFAFAIERYNCIVSYRAVSWTSFLLQAVVCGICFNFNSFLLWCVAMHQFLSIILFRNVPHRWMSCCLHYIILHHLSLYHVVLYCKVLCSTVLLCSLTSWPALYFTILYYTVCSVLHIIVTSAQKLKENKFNFEEENSRKWSDLFLSIFSFRIIIISTQLSFSCRQGAAGPKRCPSNILRDLTVAPDYQPHLISDQQILLQCYQQLLCAIIVLSTETAEDKLLEWKSF